MPTEGITKGLRRRFPPELELKKPGRGSSGELTYVAGEVVIERLLDVLECGWSWRVVHVQLTESVVLVRGELEAMGQVYHGADAHPVFSSKSPQQAADALGNAVKSAETGALVRAARLLGVGLYLWRGGAPSEAEALAPKPATDRQLKAIMAISRALGWTSEALRQHSIKLMGAPPEKLSKADAGILISELKNLSSQEEGDTAPFEIGEVTERQLEAIGVIAKSLGWKMPELREAAGGRDPRELTEDQAEELLGSLRARTGA